MNRVKQWVNGLGVKKKLVFYGYLTISPVLFIICVALLFHNYKNSLEEKLKNDLSSVNTLADSIGVLQSDIKDFSTYICINTEVHSLLVADNVHELNQNAKLWLEEAPMQIVQDMIALKGHIKTIAIYPENGIRPYLRCMDGSAYVSDMEKIRDSSIYKETLNSTSGMVWKSVPKGTGESYQTNRYDKVVLYREIFDLTQKQTLGYIVIGVDQGRFRKLCESTVKNNQESIIILDVNGGELIQIGELDEGVEEYLKSEAFMKQNYLERPSHFTYGDYDVVCNQSERNASIVCKIVPRYKLQMQLFDTIYMPMILLAGMMIGLMPLLLIISNIVTKPLTHLSEAIKKFSAGDFEQQVEVSTHDEVGEVAECFNKMVKDIKELIDQNYVMTLQEKESELAALQAQINPHFLYNTLDSLYWQVVEIGNDEIAENILALSQLFRLVLSQGQKEVTVEQEMELISRYLQIQKMRFTKRLNYEIEVEESVKKVKIPKLILQPFVENAIVHGFENITVPCYLKVTVREEKEFLYCSIQDTGIGMNQNQIAEIYEEEPVQYSKQRIGKYAIKNIRERLELKYQQDFKLEITSEVGKGTMVVLRIPLEKRDEGCH